MTKRAKRKLSTKSLEETTKVPRKWQDEEMKALLDCIIEHGHKNFQKFEECLPHRNLETVKTFLRTVHSTATKKAKGHECLDFWINRCSVEAAPWRDSIQIAQVIKYLSVDGLLENHPLPESCQGIDFRQAYRLIYQALLGYPIQPVNQPTADFIMETLADLNNEIKKEVGAIQNLNEFLNKSDNNPIASVKSESDTVSNKPMEKKPLRVYGRKKPKIEDSSTPSIKIVVEESESSSCGLGSTKKFSITVKGSNSSQSTVVDVPVAAQKAVNKEEEELLKSRSYNPFNIPNKWLEEPLFLNLKQKP